MTLAEVVLVLAWIGVTAYAVLAGADFGAGFWDLTAGGAAQGRSMRHLAEHAIAPVWEANHVWLIYVFVVLWTGFPRPFAAMASTLYIPLTGVAIGVILRGAAFAFRKSIADGEVDLKLERAFGATFAASSVVTPFFLGTVAGAVASGRVPLGNARGDAVRSWVNPTSILGGTLAVATCSFVAAVFLCVEAEREEPALTESLRQKAIGAGLVCGMVASIGVAVLKADSPQLFHGLTHRGLPLVIVSGLSGLAALVLLRRRQFRPARLSGALAVVAIVWGWAAGQYPDILIGSVTIQDGAGARATLMAVTVAVIAGAVVLVPSLLILFRLAQRGTLGGATNRPVSGTGGACM